MAIGVTNNNLNPFAASAAGGGGVKVALGALDLTMTTVTIDATYAAGGIPLTPAQLGHVNSVLAGWVVVRTGVATASPANGTLDCTNPAAPKLKLLGASALAELANAAGSGAVLDVWSVGD